MAGLDMNCVRITPALTLFLGFVTTVQAIDCYKCTSVNGKSEDCEDTFEREMKTVHLIERECFYGSFKGTHCIKFKGEMQDGTRITVRDCSDSDWGSHCGDIRYLHGDEEQMITGCLEGCQHDGCNKANTRTSIVSVGAMMFVVVVLVTLMKLNNFRIT